jgi:DNA repair protein RadA/Sms
MMAKKVSVQFICSNCGATSSSWSGRCFNCGEWNTLQEQVPLTGSTSSSGHKLKVETLSTSLAHDSPRLPTEIIGVDDVLGGGIVAGSVILLAGQPGVGKSTLLMQLADALASHHKVLYISGEESAHQISMRANRLGAKSKKLEIANANSTDDIAETISQGDYSLVIVDSIQTVTCNGVNSAAGSVSQITNSTYLLSAVAKRTDTALILVGHVTKEGSIAGPKLLEHMVDVVLQIEGDRYDGFKVLRANKNRYGSIEEVGIFEMVETGFRAVDNPSAALLSERQVSDGSVVLATMEGSRPILVEVQALVNKTSYGYPKRTASGFDLNRLNLLVAMLEKRTKLNLSSSDIYINIVGGIRITEPAADLAVCMAIASASRGMQLKTDAVVFGEVGLSGEVRHVPFIEKRISEAAKLGFSGTIGPSLKNSKNTSKHHGVSNVRTALNSFLEKD